MEIKNRIPSRIAGLKTWRLMVSLVQQTLDGINLGSRRRRCFSNELIRHALASLLTYVGCNAAGNARNALRTIVFITRTVHYLICLLLVILRNIIVESKIGVGMLSVCSMG